MGILVYISTVIAIVSSCLFISNIIADIDSALTWRTTLGLNGGEDPQKTSDRYAIMRIILSIIMGLSWGVVIVG